MSLESNTVETSKNALFESLLDDTAGEVLGVDLDKATVAALIKGIRKLGEPPRVRVLARESVLKRVRSEFVLASAAAEFVEEGRLGLRTTDEPFENVLAVTEDSVVALMTAGDRTVGLVTHDGTVVEHAWKRWSEVWETAEEFSLRTPARSRVEESLKTEFGPEVVSDFSTMVDTLRNVRSEKDGLDEVGVSLLVAAKHEVLLYDISKWGEDVGVASKATFSRTKTNLEERGLLDTEKVPIDVGRPRLRLVLGDDRLREATADELPALAQKLLSRVPA